VPTWEYNYQWTQGESLDAALQRNYDGQTKLGLEGWEMVNTEMVTTTVDAAGETPGKNTWVVVSYFKRPLAT
jgi:hypothetical protein